MQTRVQLRKTLRARRLALSDAERANCARRIAEHLMNTQLVLRARRIACYLPMQGEVDLRLFMAQARELGKEIFLPVLSPLRDHRLWFSAYHADTRLRPNRFGIPEPIKRKRETLMPRQLDLVLTPLVGFDARGERLGMGGGFYDRSFAFKNHRGHWQRPRLIGCAYAFQEVERLIHYPWDVRLDAVVTEQALRRFEPHR